MRPGPLLLSAALAALVAGASTPARADGVRAKIALGAGYRQLYSVPITGADIGLSVGGEKGPLAVFWDARVLWGATEFGLAVRDVQAGPSLELATPGFARLRLSLGLFLTFISIPRATDHKAMSDLGYGGALGASIDVVQTRPVALYVFARLQGQLFAGHASTPGMWGPSAGLGLRF